MVNTSEPDFSINGFYIPKKEVHPYIYQSKLAQSLFSNRIIIDTNDGEYPVYDKMHFFISIILKKSLDMGVGFCHFLSFSQSKTMAK